MAGESVLGLVLAGSAGKRLAPLTDDRAKSAVPFGGLYRLVDFALSNLVNAGITKICVLTQYKSHSLDRHITTTWRLNSLMSNYVATVPAQQRLRHPARAGGPRRRRARRGGAGRFPTPSLPVTTPPPQGAARPGRGVR